MKVANDVGNIFGNKVQSLLEIDWYRPSSDIETPLTVRARYSPARLKRSRNSRLAEMRMATPAAKTHPVARVWRGWMLMVLEGAITPKTRHGIGSISGTVPVHREFRGQQFNFVLKIRSLAQDSP